MKPLKEKISFVLVISFVCFFLYNIILSIKKTDDLKYRGVYTSAKIVNTYFGLGSGPRCNFRYFINGKEYKGSANLMNKKVGSCYLLKYDSQLPSNYELISDLKFKICSDSVLNITWKEKPWSLILDNSN